VVWVGRYMVKLVHRNQPIIEGGNAKLIDRKAEGGVSTHQNLIVAVEEGAQRFDLAAVVRTRRIAQVPFWLYLPVGPKAVLRQRFVVKARADRLFRHHDNGLLHPLVMQL